MNTELRNLHSYFHALNVFMVGDLLVFDKNCDLADKSDSYFRPSSNASFKELTSMSAPAYSSIYNDQGSHVMGAYLENPNPRLTIPLVLTLFSVMELLGIFYTGKINPGSTKKNIFTFFEKVPNSERPTNDEINKLVSIYRHGIAHQYFPKNSSPYPIHLKIQTAFFLLRIKII